MQISKVHFEDVNFPEQLRNIPLAPRQLYVIGELGDAPMVAIVGTRKPSTYGRQVTYDFAFQLAQAGVTIVSGLATGIDTAAHEGALDAGGKTIAVQARGLDAIYPASNRRLALRILEQGGAFVSEYEPGTPPLKHHFLDRNRIISGLALGVVVTEADTESGALVTAKHAKEQDRTIMAVPGNITSPHSAGPNNLIRDVAVPVVSASDILAAVGLGSNQLPNTQIQPASAVEASVLEAMGKGLASAHDLIEATKLEAAHFAQVISLMEISGKVRNLGAGHWIPRR